MSQERGSANRMAIMISLIAAGEAVFFLPFVVARIFRPTFLDVFELTNFQLGSAFSVYGIVAMGSYFAGGPLADRYSARRLMAAALIATSLGGVVFATIPSLSILTFLYGFWGLTSILLFWAALIRATREWGGLEGQGRAFGILDGGRGLFAAIMGSITVLIFAALLPEDVATASLADRTSALVRVIWIFTGMVVFAAALVWFAVPDSDLGSADIVPNRKLTWRGIQKVAKMPSVWLQAIIVVCAYVGYKSTDDFSLYVQDAFGYDDVVAAQIGTISFWIRPIAAIGAGLLADKLRSSNVIMASFALLTACSLFIASGMLNSAVLWIIITTIAATSACIYALRGIYFCLFEEAKVPLAVTGSAIGLVSLIGYTPDIFMGPVMGWLIDRSPGAIGHQHVFAVVALFSIVGLFSSVLFKRVIRAAN